MNSPVSVARPGRSGLIFNYIGRHNIRGDFFGGLTAAVIALPMALAFGVASGAGAAAGLWSAAIIGLVTALFGGTPALISEPTGPMTVVFTAVLATLTTKADSPAQALAIAFTVVMLSGVFQILYGMLRLGRYITQMPYTVISGFMSGIGTILIVLQIGPLLGQAPPAGGVLGTLQALPQLLQGIQPMETALALITLAVLWFTPERIRRLIPVPLFALIVGTILSLVVFQGVDLRRIGEIPSGLPQLTLPALGPEVLQLVVINAALLGMLGSIDCLLTCLVSDSLTREEHQSDKELVGQGLANIVAGLCGALPGSGATTATVVNIQAGGRTGTLGPAEGPDSRLDDPGGIRPGLADSPGGLGGDRLQSRSRYRRLGFPGEGSPTVDQRCVHHLCGDRSDGAGRSDGGRGRRHLHCQHHHHRQDEPDADRCGEGGEHR